MGDEIRNSLRHGASTGVLPTDEGESRWTQAIQEAAQLRKSLTHAEDKLLTANQELENMNKSLKIDGLKGALEVINRIKGIEARGRIRVDLRNGDVELLSPVEFKSRKVTETPDAVLEDEAAVEPLIVDMVELFQMFQ